jgi:hypothetical protein
MVKKIINNLLLIICAGSYLAEMINFCNKKNIHSYNN